MPRLILLLVPVSLALGLLATWSLMRLAGRWGVVDVPGSQAHKGHERAVPNVGGVAIFWSMVLPTLAVLAAAWWLPMEAWSGWLGPAAEHVRGLRATGPTALGVLGCVLALHAVGLIDDRRPLGPWSKLAAQTAVAAVLAGWLGVRVLEMLTTWAGPAGTMASVLVSMLWIVAVTNAMNMLDNMDGLSGGVGAIVSGVILWLALAGGQWFVAAQAALLLGALLGFLAFNYPRARVFMGDGGSLVLGLMLAVLSVRTTYTQLDGLRGEETIRAVGRTGWHHLLMPMVMLAVPLYDMASVMALRWRQGRSPLRGDRQHFSHRLVERGLGKASAVAVIWMCALATGLGAIAMSGLPAWGAAVIGAQTLAVLWVLGMLESAGRGGRNARGEREA